MFSRYYKWKNHTIDPEDVGPPDIYKPVVCIHGLMDPTFTLDIFSDIIRKYHPGTQVHVICLYNGFTSLTPLWDQIEKFRLEVERIAEQYPDGIHLVGVSQGTLIARGILETSSKHNVDTFISIAGPLMGQYGLSKLDKLPGYNWFIKTTTKWIQNSALQQLSVAGYWKDPYNIDLYKSTNTFLPILNNEVLHQHSEEFKTNFTRIKRLVLVASNDDDVITPWQSSLFGYYDEDGNVVEMYHQEIYKNDSFGLKTLDDRGAITTYVIPNMSHHHFSYDIPFIKDYILPCLT